MTQNLEARIAELEGDLDTMGERVESLVDRLGDAVERIAALEGAQALKRSRAKPAGGQYRDQLLAIFNASPKEYFRPSALAKQLKLDWHFQVPVAQACKGLVNEGLLEAREHFETGRPEYRKAQSA